MGKLRETVLEKSLKQVLLSQDPRVRNFSISLIDKKLNPVDYEKRIKEEVEKVGDFEVYHVHSHPSWPNHYDIWVRRK